MSLEIYSAIFWVIAIISIILQDRKAESGEAKVASLTTVVKILPALMAAVFVIIFRPPTLFTLLLAGALVFCMFGDVGMEVDIAQGTGMFLIAHILYTSNFLLQAGTVGVLMGSILLSAVCMSLMVVFLILFIRYLRSSGPDIPPLLLRAGTLYFIMVSATISTTLLLWQTSGVVLGYLPFVGALFFILGDAILVAHEFHHKLSRHEFYIMPTYYLAIFLLSLSVFVYMF